MRKCCPPLVQTCWTLLGEGSIRLQSPASSTCLRQKGVPPKTLPGGLFLSTKRQVLKTHVDDEKKLQLGEARKAMDLLTQFRVIFIICESLPVVLFLR